MATMYRTNGAVEEIIPVNGKKFTLEEAQGLVGGYLQMVKAKGSDRKTLTVLCDEDGLHKSLPFNRTFYERCQPWNLVGDVLVVKRGEF